MARLVTLYFRHKTGSSISSQSGKAKLANCAVSQTFNYNFHNCAILQFRVNVLNGLRM